MSRKWRNILIGVLVAALVIAGFTLLSRGTDNYKDKYEGTDLSTDVSGIGRSNTYGAYVAQFADLPAVTETVEVDLQTHGTHSSALQRLSGAARPAWSTAENGTDTDTGIRSRISRASCTLILNWPGSS